MAGCATDDGPVTVDPEEAADAGADGKADGFALVPDVTCARVPDAGPKTSFRHFSSKVTAFLGSAKHRGIDLIATASNASQTIAGAISYTIADKALEDEDVDVFACRAGAWRKLGRVRTDDEGRFSLKLTGSDRLSIGMRDMFVSVAGDRTGARFLAYVAPDGASLIVSDVDGTLTSSENAFLSTVVLGKDAGVREGGPDALGVARARGYQLIYVTARGQQYTEATRGWFQRKGFPRGPLRLSPSFITLPGGDTVDYKTETLRAIAANGLDLVAGIGNRASYIEAYGNAGIAPDRTFIEATEYADEVLPEVDAGRAVGFTSYDELAATELANLPPL